MDCPSEEQLIKMRLEGLYDALEFDIPGRKLEVWHTVGAGEILSSLDTLNLETTLLLSGESKKTPQKHIIQKKLLWAVLWINFVFFAVEILTGYFSRSMGLVADSLDMLADASVYALAIFAIGGLKNFKKQNCCSCRFVPDNPGSWRCGGGNSQVYFPAGNSRFPVYGNRVPAGPGRQCRLTYHTPERKKR